MASTCPISLAGPAGDNGHALWPAQTATATLECDDAAFFGAPLVAKLVLTADASVEDPCSWRALFGALRVTAVANPPIVGFAHGHPKTTIAGLRVEYHLELPAITSEQVPFCPANEGHMELAVEVAAPPLSAGLGAAPAGLKGGRGLIGLFIHNVAALGSSSASRWRLTHSVLVRPPLLLSRLLEVDSDALNDGGPRSIVNIGLSNPAATAIIVADAKLCAVPKLPMQAAAAAAAAVAVAAAAGERLSAAVAADAQAGRLSSKRLSNGVSATLPPTANAKPPPPPSAAAAGSSGSSRIGSGSGTAGDGSSHVHIHSSRATDERILPLLLAPGPFPLALAPGASYALACCTPPGEDHVLTVSWRPMAGEAVRGAVEAAPQSLDAALAEVDLDVASPVRPAAVGTPPVLPDTAPRLLPNTAPRLLPDTAPCVLLDDARRGTPPCAAPHVMASAPSRVHEVHFLIAAAPRATNELVSLAAIAPTTALALGQPFRVTLQLTNHAKEPWEELVLTFTPAPTVLCLTERVRVGSLKLDQTTSVVVQMVGLVVGMVAERLEVVGRSTSGSELRTFQASCLVYVRIVDPLLGAMESTGTPTPSEPPRRIP